jgi:hypothetical protein
MEAKGIRAAYQGGEARDNEDRAYKRKSLLSKGALIG